MVRYFMVGMMLFGTAVAMPLSVSAQTTTAEEDPNDKTAQERSFEETRKHMQLHSEWSKKSGKMNDN